MSQGQNQLEGDIDFNQYFTGPSVSALVMTWGAVTYGALHQTEWPNIVTSNPATVCTVHTYSME